MSGTGKTVTYVAATGDARIDGILQGAAWADATLSFSTPATRADYGTGYGMDEQDGLVRATAAMGRIFDFALAKTGGADDGFSVEGFTRLSVQLTTADNAHIRLAQTSRDPYALGTAWSYFPSTFATGGDVWFFSQHGDYAAPVAGDYAALTLIHEIGHALGLYHGHETNGIWGALPAAYDSMEYSLMTYRSYQGAGVDGGYPNETYGYAQSWMMLDIAALQHLYGADYSTNSGDTVYSWAPGSGSTRVDGAAAITPGANRIFATIWDGGGTDTYDLSAYTGDLQIDLAPGGHSVFGAKQLADLGDGHSARGNIFNALLHEGDTRSLIENARGGAGDDSLRGNAADNRLEGRGGDDRLTGLGGNDLLLGGAGRDRLKGGGHDDNLHGGADRDRVFGARGEDRLFGDKGNDLLSGGPGDDVIRGGPGRDLILGNGGRDVLLGGGGADVFRFTATSDSAPFDRSDHIRDFTSGTDTIDLSVLGPGRFELLRPGAEFSGTGPSVITKTRGDDIVLRADLDGDGRADFGIVLDAVSGIAAEDFLL